MIENRQTYKSWAALLMQGALAVVVGASALSMGILAEQTMGDLQWVGIIGPLAVAPLAIFAIFLWEGGDDVGRAPPPGSRAAPSNRPKRRRRTQ